MHPIVSIVMSVYNGERFIRESVDSILNQTFRDFELIIINDGSSDKTMEILKSYNDNRIILIIQKNMGLAKALNNGIAMAKGRYIARQDADDKSDLDRLEKQVNYMEANLSVGLLGTMFKVIDENGTFQRNSCLPVEEEIIKERLIEINQFCHGSVMMRKEALEKVGVYRDYFKYAQDYDLWLRISESFQVSNLPEPLYCYRELRNAISSNHIVKQSKYAGVAAMMALQRREKGTDEIQQGITPALPPLKDLSARLQKKIVDFFGGMSLEDIERLNDREELLISRDNNNDCL